MELDGWLQWLDLWKEIAGGKIGETIGLALSVVAIIISALLLQNSFKKRNFEKKENKKAKIVSDLKMYSDIAYSNHWNWLPQDVVVNNPRHSEYRGVIRKFVSYLYFVDPEIKETYQYVVDKFNSSYKDNERTDIWKKYEEIRDFSKNKSEELGKELRRI